MENQMNNRAPGFRLNVGKLATMFFFLRLHIYQKKKNTTFVVSVVDGLKKKSAV